MLTSIINYIKSYNTGCKFCDNRGNKMHNMLAFYCSNCGSRIICMRCFGAMPIEEYVDPNSPLAAESPPSDICHTCYDKE